MKIKYLPLEDRQNLRMLRHAKTPGEIAAILNPVGYRMPTLQVIWAYRKYFYKLTHEEYEKYMNLKVGLALIKVMEGNLDEAKRIIDSLPDNTLQKLYCQIMYPTTTYEEHIALVKKMKELNIHMPSMTITAGRPSVLSGVWDFTDLIDGLLQDDQSTKDIFTVLFEEKGSEVVEVLKAEILYQRDEIYEALVKVVGLIPFLRDKKDMRLLFVALTLQCYIMVLNDHATASTPMIEALREQIITAGLEEYIPNIDALEAWAAMYDGDYAKVVTWLNHDDPDEFGKFNMLNLFRYMVKIRAYIIQGKYLAITSLASRLKPLLQASRRYMDLCELEVLWAISEHARGEIDSAFQHLEDALFLAEKFRFDRVISDQGKRVYDLLVLYKKVKGSTPYIDRVMKLSKKIAMYNPGYLKTQLPEAPKLTKTELYVLRLLEQGLSNAEIASITKTTVDNAKFHCKKIYSKLEVSSRHQAVKRAKEIGILNQ